MENEALPQSCPTALGEFSAGLRAELPILVGVVPFGLIYGVVAMAAGMPPLAAQAMSAVVFAGSSQFLIANLFAVATPAGVMVLAAAIVNLRHALYSASVAPYLNGLSQAWKWLLAYLLTDEAYAVTITHYQQESATGADASPLACRHWFFLGAGLTLWTSWQLSTAAGIFLGQQVPSSWSLDFTIALTFIALVVPAIKDRAALAAALSAGLVALMAFSLPYRLGLVAAALAGIAAGMLVEGKK